MSWIRKHNSPRTNRSRYSHERVFKDRWYVFIEQGPSGWWWWSVVDMVGDYSRGGRSTLLRDAKNAASAWLKQR